MLSVKGTKTSDIIPKPKASRNPRTFLILVAPPVDRDLAALSTVAAQCRAARDCSKKSILGWTQDYATQTSLRARSEPKQDIAFVKELPPSLRPMLSCQCR